MSKFCVGKTPKPWVVVIAMAFVAVTVVCYSGGWFSSLVASMNISFDENLRNRTLEIKRVQDFVTELGYVKTRFITNFGIVAEDVREERCRVLKEKLESARDAFFIGKRGKEYGIAYSVSGSANLDVTAWVVDGKIVKGDATRNILMRHEKERAKYTNVLAYDRVHFGEFCEKYEQRLSDFVEEPSFEHKFVTEVVQPMVCIDRLTTSWAWEVCPLGIFSKNEEWARKIYEKAEETVKETFGNNFEKSCNLHLENLFGKKWEVLKSDMALRAQDDNRGTRGREPCSILATASDVTAVSTSVAI